MHHFLAFEDSIAIVRNRNQMCEDLAAWFLSVVTHRHTHTHTHTLCFTYNGGVGKILKSKRKEIGSQATKLRNGLGRLRSAAEQVAEMTTESEIKRADVSKKQAECQDMK